MSTLEALLRITEYIVYFIVAWALIMVVYASMILYSLREDKKDNPKHN